MIMARIDTLGLSKNAPQLSKNTLNRWIFQ